MSFTKGNFTCPNCGSNQMNGYEHWIFKRISSNKTRWIFFKINIQKHGRKWTFFCKCFEDGFKCRCCKNQEGKIIGDAIAKSDSEKAIEEMHEFIKEAYKNEVGLLEIRHSK